MVKPRRNLRLDHAYCQSTSEGIFKLPYELEGHIGRALTVWNSRARLHDGHPGHQPTGHLRPLSLEFTPGQPPTAINRVAVGSFSDGHQGFLSERELHRSGGNPVSFHSIELNPLARFSWSIYQEMNAAREGFGGTLPVTSPHLVYSCVHANRSVGAVTELQKPFILNTDNLW